MLIGSLIIRSGVDLSGMSRGLAAGGRMVDAWSKVVGSKVDGAFEGLARSNRNVGLLAGSLSKIERASKLAKTGLAVADVGRAAGWSKVGLDKLRLAFTADAKRAEELRTRIEKTSGALRTVGAVSRKIRLGLLAADLGVLAVKLGAVGGGLVGRFARGLADVGMGAVHAASGLVRTGEAVAGVAINSGRAVKSFGAFTASVFKRDWAGALLNGFGAVQSGKAALSWLPGLGSMFAGLARGVLAATGGLLKMGTALGGLALRGAVSLVGGLTTAFGGLARSTISVGVGLAKMAAVGGVVGTILGVKAAGAAAHLTETFNKTNQVFGKDGAGVIATAEKMNAAFGVSRKEFLDGASAIGGMLQGMGYAQKDAAGLSSSLARLAADAAAFRDVPLDVALQKIRSGLSGEAEPLKEWGVLIDEASVKNEALRMGIIKQGQDLSQAGKVQARLSLITKGLGKDSGALTRESSGTAAQMAEVWGRLQTLWEQIGASIAPALGVALQGVNQAIVAAGLAWEDGKAAVLGWFGVTNESLGQANGGVGILQTSIGWLADAWSVVKGATAGFFSYFESGISAISGWLSSIFGALEKIGAGDWATSARKALDDYSAAAKTVSDDLWKSSQEAFGSIGKGSAAVDDYFARAAQKIEAAKAELAKTNGVNAAVKPTAAAAEADDKKKKKGKGEQFAGAYSANSKEAANVVLRSRYGSGGDDAAKAAKATAANTKAAADATIDLGRKFGDWLTKQATAAAAQLVSL